MSWHESAACDGMRTDLFYPNPTDDVTLLAARVVCAGCPVREECLTDALRADMEHGVRGGLTPRERNRIARRLRRKAA